MKHRQVTMNKVGVLNAEGHAVGLDIGATGVRASILVPGMVGGRPSVTVQGIGSVPLPPGTVVNGAVQEPNVLSRALKELWAENKFECRNVILGIANQQVLVRDLKVPNLDAAQRAKALPFQAKEIVALPLDEVVLDFCQLSEPDPETNMVRGLLIAAPREPILAAVAGVEKANLKVARVDLSSFGALRSIGSERLTVEAVVDIGAHLTTIVIHDNGVPKLVRTLARGGEHLTEQVADRLSISAPEAEKAKCVEGLLGDNQDVTRALVDGLRPLVAEIRTSIGYFRTTTDSGPIERISLTGGGAHLNGMPRAVEEQIGIPVNLVDPMQHIRNRQISKQALAANNVRPPSAVAIGLAMGAAA